MVTFLAAEDDARDFAYASLPPRDQDFIDYWWGLLFRQLREESAQGIGMSTAFVHRPTQADTVDEEDFQLAAEEFDLIKELERQEGDKLAPMTTVEKEFQNYQDCQELDTQARVDEWLREREASQYRDGDRWEFELEMKRPPPRTRTNQIRVRVQGGIAWPSTSWSLTSASRSGSSQSMEWTMEPGEGLQLRVHVEPGKPNTTDRGVPNATIDETIHVTTEGGRTARKSPETSTEPAGMMNAELEGSEGSSQGRGVRRPAIDESDDKRRISAKLWDKVLPGTTEINLDDYQHPT